MSSPNGNSRRFVGLGSNPRAYLRLFCFPFAGGGASVYREWRFSQNQDLEVVAVELPGREKRVSEPLLRHASSVVTDVVNELPTDRPFAMFGHSMGGLLIFEIARALRELNVNPSHLFVSAFRAPHLPQRTRLKHFLPDDDLIEEIRRANGTPQELIDNVEVLQLIMARLRADLSVVETYSHISGQPLQCPITVFGGRDDQDVSHAELVEWSRHTSGRFRLQMMDGHHFYLYEAKNALLNSIRTDLGLTVTR